MKYDKCKNCGYNINQPDGEIWLSEKGLCSICYSKDIKKNKNYYKCPKCNKKLMLLMKNHYKCENCKEYYYNENEMIKKQKRMF